MAFPVTQINEPSDAGGTTCQAGSLLVGFRTGGVVTVFDLDTETTSAWQMTSPSGSHALNNPATPWMDPATGLVWTTFSTTYATALMFVRFNPTTGATAYYPTASLSYWGPSRVAVVGDFVVSFTGGQITRFDKTTGTVATRGAAYTNFTRPWVYNNTVYVRSESYSGLGKYSPATNTWSFVSQHSIGQAIANAQPLILGGSAYVTGAWGVIVTDLATESTSLITVTSGFLGAALALHTDGRIYSKPSSTLVGCWDPNTLEVASTAQAGASVFGVAYNGFVYFPSMAT